MSDNLRTASAGVQFPRRAPDVQHDKHFLLSAPFLTDTEDASSETGPQAADPGKVG